MTTSRRRPCLTHGHLRVDIKLDNDRVTSARRADVTVVCLDCGTETVHGEHVPVEVTQRGQQKGCPARTDL